MPFLDLVMKRFSVRKFLEKPIDPDALQRCIEAARLAPSACNSQPWHFIIVDDPELRARISAETTTPLIPVNHFVAQAPILIVVLSEKGSFSSRFGSIVRQREFRWIDLGIAVEHICLQAAEEGIGTCIIGWFNEKPIKKILDIPHDKSIGLLIAMGHTERDAPADRMRKDIDAIRSCNRYGRTARNDSDKGSRE